MTTHGPPVRCRWWRSRILDTPCSAAPPRSPSVGSWPYAVLSACCAPWRSQSSGSHLTS